MNNLVNFSELFIETHNEYFEKYKNKNNNGNNIKHVVQKKYLNLLEFTRNSSYWSRFNLDTEKMDIKKKNDETFNKYIYKKDCISGKYLNEMHIFLTKHNFYKKLYVKLLNIYLELTNYETLKSLSIDSTFIRNIIGNNLHRNPHYNNKPGLKIHAIVDSNRVVIATLITDCTINDSVTIKNLFDNLLVDHDLLKKHIDVFLADSSYSSFYNTHYLTNIGFRSIIGRNKQHTKQSNIINDANTDQIYDYKKRGTVENFFGNIQRYPCILNNYQRSLSSYDGLLFFVMSSILAKKINNIICENNNTDIKQKREADNNIKREQYEKRKQMKYKQKKDMDIIREKQNKQRKEEIVETENKLNNIIWSKVDKKKLKKRYDKQIYKNKNKNQKRLSYNKYESYVKKGIYKHVKNNKLMKVYEYKFGKKKLYITDTDKHTFQEENITNIMNHTDQKEIINKLCNSFFIDR